MLNIFVLSTPLKNMITIQKKNIITIQIYKAQFPNLEIQGVGILYPCTFQCACITFKCKYLYIPMIEKSDQ